jgi:hypothetical protein
MYCNACTRLGYHEMAETSVFGLGHGNRTTPVDEATVARIDTNNAILAADRLRNAALDAFFAFLQRIAQQLSTANDDQFRALRSVREGCTPRLWFTVFLEIVLLKNGGITEVPWGDSLDLRDTALEQKMSSLIHGLPDDRIDKFVKRWKFKIGCLGPNGSDFTIAAVAVWIGQLFAVALNSV